MASTMRVSCCIAGGGPAGVMLGFLLARAGVKVAVLEKHKESGRFLARLACSSPYVSLISELPPATEWTGAGVGWPVAAY
jgi:2-polyprenyl-6-methoxyphenol hydroxylase-like FAD-dependent oxidoreductase